MVLKNSKKAVVSTIDQSKEMKTCTFCNGLNEYCLLTLRLVFVSFNLVNIKLTCKLVAVLLCLEETVKKRTRV